MKARLVCGRCGASSAQRRDQCPNPPSTIPAHVASAALLSRKTSGTDYPTTSLPLCLASPLEFRSSHKGFRGTSRRGGRPALSPAERRQRARDRKRRLRARNREKSRSESHVRMTDTTANRVPSTKGSTMKRNERNRSLRFVRLSVPQVPEPRLIAHMPATRRLPTTTKSPASSWHPAAVRRQALMRITALLPNQIYQSLSPASRRTFWLEEAPEARPNDPPASCRAIRTGAVVQSSLIGLAPTFVLTNTCFVYVPGQSDWAPGGAMPSRDRLCMNGGGRCDSRSLARRLHPRGGAGPQSRWSAPSAPEPKGGHHRRTSSRRTGRTGRR